jgi:mycoredoxin
MDLTVYTAPWCGTCRIAKAWLRKHNIAFTEVDIDEDAAAAAELIKATGKRAIPHFLIDGTWVQPYEPRRGFKYREMAELFGVTD